MEISNNIIKIMLRRKNILLLDNIKVNQNNLPISPMVLDIADKKAQGVFLAATVGRGLEQLGYILSESLFEDMINDIEITKKVSSDFVINALKELKGADVEYIPMYPNFPSQVINANDLHLYINAMIHYLSDGKLLPASDEYVREKAKERKKLTPLFRGDESDVKILIDNLIKSAKEWSVIDRLDMFSIFSCMECQEVLLLIKNTKFSNKENLAYIAKMLYQLYGFEGFSSIGAKIEVPTDILRIINVIHGNGDASLSAKVVLSNIPRRLRRLYLYILNGLPYELSKKDMKNNYKLWILVGEKLHPNESGFKKSFPIANKLFSEIRDKNKLKEIKTVYKDIEDAIEYLKGSDSIEQIKQIKPIGIFARNLDRILRVGKNTDEILEYWEECAKKASVVLLWDVYAHFLREYNSCDTKYRIFISKGANSKTVIRKDIREPIPKDVCRKVIDITYNAIVSLYKGKPEMGKVYISDDVKKCKYPNNNRGKNISNKSIAKGIDTPHT